MAVTTAQDVLAHFAVTEAAKAAYLAWQTDDRYRSTVVPCVLGHRVAAAYALTHEDVLRACAATELPYGHALGTVRKAEAERVVPIRDWNPPFAFTQVLHHLLEQMGSIPTWPEFVDYIRWSREGREMLGNDAGLVLRAAGARVDSAGNPRWTAPAINDALRWRLGNAYYSFLRELHVLVHLRARGLDARVHPLADALFRADAWIGRTVLSIYIGNPRYRHEHEGRKQEAQRLLGAAPRPFTFESINLPNDARRGMAYLAPDTLLEQRVQELLAQSPRAPGTKALHG
ncbi:hypothetical protein [Streptacidiphilus albus]|uniref:hypothetical protein n=1 Tax=Streptacidiphilus albus TaxID=105425 RepID=UPI00128E207C|nr:hypothetical protein [Streptacidiphilus albus]